MFRQAAKPFLFAVSLLVAVGTIEVGFRITNKGRPPEWSFYHPRGYLTDDPVLGFAPTPGFSSPWKKFMLSNNSAGFRDAEHAVEKGPGVMRVLAVGDSQTWGANVDVGSTYLRQLAVKKNIEVLLGGVPGYASDQAVARFRREAPRWKPDVALLAVFLDHQYGDLPRLAAHKHFGLYRVAGGHLVPNSVAMKIQGGGLRGAWAALVLYVRANSHLSFFIRSFGADPTLQGQFFVPLTRISPAEKNETIGMLIDNLRDFQTAAAEAKAKPIVIFIPSLAHYLAPDPSAKATTEEVLRRTRRLGLLVLDLHPRFYRNLSEQKPLYFPDNHLSPVGHEVVAEELEKFFQ